MPASSFDQANSRSTKQPLNAALKTCPILQKPIKNTRESFPLRKRFNRIEVNMSYVLFFDSGLGGLSVMKEAIALHSEENYIYYADNIHLPYGDKTLEEIRKYTIDAISGVIDAYPVKAVVIACNTATSAACRPLRQIYPDIPVIGIEPAIKPAAETFSGGNIGVLATEATLRQPKFLALTEKFSSLANIIPIPMHPSTEQSLSVHPST